MLITTEIRAKDEISTIYIINKDTDLSKLKLNENIVKYLKNQLDNDKDIISVNLYENWLFFYVYEDKKEHYLQLEKARKAGYKLAKEINVNKIQHILINDMIDKEKITNALAEGLALSNYQFLKYLTSKDKKENSLKEICIKSPSLDKEKAEELNNLIQGVYYTRDLINEPQSYLNSVVLSEEIQKLGKEAGFGVEIFNKEKIEELNMGGLLAVNMGSVIEPTFSILTWEPENAVNDKHIVLVGKGVVYDTGGLSLKPTADSMDIMKSDMGGAAAVIGAIYAIAKNNIPVKVIGLIPATDNRPDGNAYAPGDIITMMNGKTVEVLNTDAEGRMILADALTYADNYEPELVIDLATLTGAAERAVGKYAIAGMGNADREELDSILESGFNTYERIVEFPFWEEYGEMMKSDIADLKNLGGANAGMITAGKFLENFTESPYIHLDIAGPSFLKSDDNYNLKGGTGSGVRLIYDFISKKAK